jgi:type IV pilus assembly protein PilP
MKSVLPVFLAMALVACGGGMSDLETYIEAVKQRPGGRIEPLPQIKPYETFEYTAQTMRSPFTPDVEKNREQGPTGPLPNMRRNKEYLEQFPLDTLSMVGTLMKGGETFGLLQTKDGLVHRVLPGNYIGQNDGRVVAVNDAEIEVEELVPNGIGSFFKRSASISLD